jgi:hypothetical protein
LNRLDPRAWFARASGRLAHVRQHLDQSLQPLISAISVLIAYAAALRGPRRPRR